MSLPLTAIQLYAVVLGATALSGLILSRRWLAGRGGMCQRLRRYVFYLYYWLLRYGVYPWILHPHRLCGPWSPVGLFLRCGYLAVNGFLVGFPLQDWHTAATRAGNLALVNMAPLYLTWSHDDAASIFGVSLRSYRQVHATVGWVIVMLIVFHAGMLWSDMPSGISAQTLSEIIVSRIEDAQNGSTLTELRADCRCAPRDGRGHHAAASSMGV